MSDVSTVTGPSAAPVRRRLRALFTRFGPDASVVLGILALAAIWAGALLAGDGILANGHHALLLAAALSTIALLPLIVVVVRHQSGLARAPQAAEAEADSAARDFSARIASYGRSLRILLAEDNSTNQLVGKQLLRVLPTASGGRVPAAFSLAVARTADEIEQQPLIDRSAVDEFIDEIGTDAAESMFATFLVETERRLGVLRDLSDDDRDAVRFEAHTLIGSSGTFGMMHLSRLSRELERKSATIAPAAYQAAVERLLEVYRVSRHELLDYLAQVAKARAVSEN